MFFPSIESVASITRSTTVSCIPFNIKQEVQSALSDCTSCLFALDLLFLVVFPLCLNHAFYHPCHNGIQLGSVLRG